jgi:fibrillarin-like rRNA methylase
MMLLLLLLMETMKIATTMTKLIQVFRADKSSHIQYVGVGVSCTANLQADKIHSSVKIYCIHFFSYLCFT